MNTKHSLIFILFFLAYNGWSQNVAYFQQQVNYTIVVTLDDEKHELFGTIEMDYTNNSLESLDFIYLHLWPNAFKNNGTAFAKQKIESGSKKFYFAEEKDRGFIDNLSFKVDENLASLETDKDHIDIAKLILPQALAPGKTIKITSPFRVRIPKSYSRLGHVGQTYQLTQWFPKPAVFDKDGWHPMPYLDQGEFYSEFGNFDVTITLPHNYVVGATGICKTASELDFIKEKVKESKKILAENDIQVLANTKHPIPPSDTKTKTIQYTAKNVHDFAWFADKRFYVQQGQTILPSGRKVVSTAMFTNKEIDLWTNAVQYLNRSIQFYSDKVGEYPYPQATAVQSALSAGAGMEYPMITVIGESGSAALLDIVVTHEVGHNWFYGILASNERVAPWMDEGMNSYIESRYAHEYIDDGGTIGLYLGKAAKIFGVQQTPMDYAAYLYQAKTNKDQVVSGHSKDFTDGNYGVSAYMTPTLFFGYLEAYLGENEMDKAMRQYFNEWKFKHPSAKDLQASFEKTTGKNLDWFFNDLIQSRERIDYAVNKAKGTEISIENKGKIPGPLAIAGYKEGKEIKLQWVEGFLGEKKINFPEGDYDEIRLDPNRTMPDINRKNNRLKVNGLFKKSNPVSLRLLPTFEMGDKSNLYVTPVIGWNDYDKTLIGLSFSNASIPQKKFEYMIAPMFGTGSKDLAGLGEVRMNLFPKKGLFQEITPRIGLKSFNKFYNFKHDYHEQYWRVNPGITFHLRKSNPRSHVQQKIKLHGFYILEEGANFNIEGNPVIKTTDRNFMELSYHFSNGNPINPYNFTIGINRENGAENSANERDHYTRLFAEGNFNFIYNAKGKGIYFRAFTGAFLENTNKDFGASPFALIDKGPSDFYYDEFFLGRSQQSGIWSQQISLTEGGFKTPIGLNQIGGVGLSNQFIAALNIEADLPLNLILPIKPYADFGYFVETQPSVTSPVQFLFNGGVMLDFKVVKVFFPLFSSKDLGTKLKANGNYLTRIGFSMDLNRVNPFKIRSNLSQ